MPQQLMARETEVTDLGAIVDWCNFMREEAEEWLYSNSAEIGGMDADGDPIIVEIDETKYFIVNTTAGNGGTVIGFSAEWSVIAANVSW